MNWTTKIIKINEAEYTFDHVCTLFWLILVYFLLYKHSERVTKYRGKGREGAIALNSAMICTYRAFLLPYFLTDTYRF